MTEEKTMSLISKLAAVSAAISGVPKNGENKHHGYKFATAEDVKNVVRAEMAKRGVFLSMSMREIIKEGMAGKMRTVVIRFGFIFHDGDSDERLETEWYGEGADTADKAITKCATSALKYFLIDTFQIPTGDYADDPDGQSPQADEPIQDPRATAHLMGIIEKMGAAEDMTALELLGAEIKKLNGALTPGLKMRARDVYMMRQAQLTKPEQETEQEYKLGS